MASISLLRASFVCSFILILSVLLSACSSGDEDTPENPNPTPPQNPSTCLADNEEFVDSLYASVDAWDGGQLYDKWWAVVGASAPANNHPLWASQSTNTRSGGDTWRCKECHGWDYKGKDGAYASGSHYTGFPGLINLNSEKPNPIDVFCAIRDGVGTNPLHKFNKDNTSNVLNDTRIVQLTKFILDTNNKGMINTDGYINPTSKAALGNATLGESIFTQKAGCASTNCHGPSGTLNAGDGALGDHAMENPWEVLHKIRNGHPGSNPEMPSFVDDGLSNSLSINEMRHVLAYVQTLAGTSACVTDNEDFVNQNLANADLWQGGRLYDKWWAEAGVAEPTGNHPLWSSRPDMDTNTRTGPDTWRCKECHGWDYKGADGAYGSGSHRTGFPGIWAAKQKSAVGVFCAIRDGDHSGHAFNSVMTDMQILAVAKFIVAEDGENGNALTDSTDYISFSTKRALGDATAGQNVYTTTAGCSGSTCHRSTGDLNVGTSSLGELSTDNPWEVLHKIRYGHPGSAMPSFTEDGRIYELNDTQISDVLAYTQTLPNNTSVSCTDQYATFVSDNYPSVTPWEGGRMYDSWWSEANLPAPFEDHPVWADRPNQTTNTRTGADTWRCKECHGWDYKGNLGAYGDTNSSHYTGFPGIRSAIGKTSLQVFCSILDGEGTNASRHIFNEGNTGLSDLRVLALTKFILGSGDNALVETDQFINPSTKQSLGNVTAGQSIFANDNGYGCNQSRCHGSSGQINVGGSTLGALSNDNPWEVLHKIRYGQPGSIMPSFISDGQPYELTSTEVSNVLAYTQTLPTGGGGGGNADREACLVDEATYVNNNYASASAIRGGALYDKWWDALSVSAPTADHAVWDRQSNNTRSGSDTWRCKECHGWDYKGDSGAYGSGSHFTGFPGVFAAASKQPVEVFCDILTGTDNVPEHDFSDSNSNLTRQAVLDLTKFITDTTSGRGMLNMDSYINSDKSIVNPNVSQGQTVYFSTPSCGQGTCHAANGQGINFGSAAEPEYLGDLAVGNPWEVLHKIRYGHPGSAMPVYLDTSLTATQMKNVVAFAQTLPVSGSGGDTIGDAARGGQLYDKWWVVIGEQPPAGVNPLFLTLQQNNQNPNLNPIVTPSDSTTTWRCKHCHGWDYAGVDGANGPGSSNYTGVKGLLDAAGLGTPGRELSVDQLRSIISNSQLGQHAWSTYLSAQDIDDLIAFVKNGIVDTELYISRSTRFAREYNEANGTSLYQTVPCVICHGENADWAPPNTLEPVLLPPLALENPWEVLHKARFGQPGTYMPQMYNGYSAGDARDVLWYLQWLGMQ